MICSDIGIYINEDNINFNNDIFSFYRRRIIRVSCDYLMSFYLYVYMKKFAENKYHKIIKEQKSLA